MGSRAASAGSSPALSPPPTVDAVFLARLALAESAVASGRLDADFLKVVRELSELASGPMESTLARDTDLRQRFDVVWMHTDTDAPSR